MELLLKEIENALKARLYYLAIVTTVTIPDVCAALKSADGESTGPKYRDWYKDNVFSELTWFSPMDCWKFRCGGVHQGRFGHAEMQYDRAVFLLPGPIKMRQGITRHISGSTAYLYGAEDFCRVFIRAARIWLRANDSDPVVQANLAHLVRVRQEGLAPHIIGVPVIA